MRLLTKIYSKIKISQSRRINKKNKVLNKNFKLHIFYRTSDKGYPKDKPDYITSYNCLKNALERFSPDIVDWHIMCDNCSKETMEWLYKLCDEYKVNRKQIYEVSVGHGAGTFRLVYEKALAFNDNDVVYFLENDYLHKKESYDAIKFGFTSLNIDYLTLYDHPDKYDKDYIYSSLYKDSRVFFDGEFFWQKILSTTMTFASRVKTLKKDKKFFWKWTNTKHPYDLYIFIDIRLKNRVMVSPIPGLSTHGEKAFLSPKVDWSKEVIL